MDESDGRHGCTESQRSNWLAPATCKPWHTETVLSGARMPIDFGDLQKALSLKNLLDQNGTAVIKAATLNSDEFTRTIINSEFYKGDIRIADPKPGPGDGSDRVVIQGRTTFPTAPIHMRGEAAQGTTGATAKDRIAMNPLEYDVVATFEIGERGTVVVTLRCKLPDNKQFSDIFPGLPRDSDPVSGKLKRQSMLDGLTLTDRYFYLTTHAHEHADDAHDVSLQPGLNLVARWQPKGALGIFESLFQQDQLVVHGSIVFPSANWVENLNDDQFVWGAEPPEPGLNLQAALNLEARFPPNGKLKFAVSSARIYCPLTMDWLLKNPDFGFGIAYIGQFEIPSANRKGTLTAEIRSGANDEIMLAGEFPDADLQHLSLALTDLVGDANLLSLMPDAIQKTLGKIGLKTLVITAARVEDSYTVTRIAFIISIGAHWTVVEKLIELELSSVRFLVANPFDAQQRAIHAILWGGLQILKESDSGLDFDVVVEAPEFAIYAEQATSKTISLKTLFQKEFPDIPSPPDIQISNISLAADPGANYSFSIDLAAGTSWTIDGTHSLPTVSVLLSNTGWQFEGRTEEGNQGIPLFALLAKLAHEIGLNPESADEVGPFPKIELPVALQEATLDSFAVSYDKPGKDFAFTCEGKFPVNNQKLDIVLTIEINHQQDDSYSKHFSGRVTIDEMEFDVTFDGNPDKTAFIAAYQDLNGHQIGIQKLVNQVSPVIARNVPESLNFTIKDALFAYCKQIDEKGEIEKSGAFDKANSATPEKENQSITLEKSSPKEAESKLLFGIDIDGGLNLSDLRLPDLPLVGPIFPHDQTLKLSFQLLAARGTFLQSDISTLNGLLANGPRLPNKDIKAALDLSTVLQIGEESKSLDLQIGVNPNAESKESGTTTGLESTTEKKDGVTVSNQVGEAPEDKSLVLSTAASGANVQSADGMQWIFLQKSFGPAHLERIGLSYKDDKIIGALDAALMAGGLTIALNGLSVSSPLTKFDPVFDLHGLGIDYRNGPLEIGGAFLKQTITPEVGDPYTAFSGLAVIRTEKLSISAIGSYANPNYHPSLFIYAVLDYPIGGPSFFFITGLAAGFGYNRGLKVPTIDNLATFPLIEEATREEGRPKLPADRQAQQDTITTELAKLETYIPPAVGENFLAIGIKFTSFKIVDSFALLIVKFGGRLEFDLLGLSTLQSPPAMEGETVTPVAKATLAFKATFIPEDGFLIVQAQLTSDSYILSQACHLTGGFAFFSWFKDANGPHGNKISAGDFVLTLGGYHPAFVIPAHYPRVPRLGIRWQVNDQLSIKGDAYFALTSHALMAGGYLEALWHSGDLRAWFKAGADFLISWKPYHYDAHIYVDIGASYTFHFFGSHTITVDLGADLHIWGPEFAGTAELHYYLFSVKVEFGAQTSQQLEPISWDEFKNSFLPADDQICTIAVQGGLVRQIQEKKRDKNDKDIEETRWILNPKDLVLVTNSVVPVKSASEIIYNEDHKPKKKSISIGNAQQTFAIAPMGITADKITSEHIVTIKRGEDCVPDDFDCKPILKAVPVALWGKPQMDGENLKPPQVNPSAVMVENTIAGFEIRPAKPPTAGATHSIDKNKFAYELESIANAYEFAPEKGMTVSFIQGADAWKQADDDLTDVRSKDVLDTRTKLLDALGFPVRMLDFGESMKTDVMIQGVSA